MTLRDLRESNASIEERASFLRREQRALRDNEKLYEALRSSDTALRELVQQEMQLLEALPQLGVGDRSLGEV